ncbi:uncharacterized protein EI90DRAFT_2332548 [Cantharellus anzutake]|uniref:uncharacterized protein n=1 Tax=Cantharellus anzutake TaxID=1750568 RepID=UPI001907019B|nr:uncharacterized protein EI90DRAFT_2332548 [Cantharellus anzutake]KAF8324427.1 hypothetical protein EI90DRAFT_2332548 [Cantharellus anzutake]
MSHSARNANNLGSLVQKNTGGPSDTQRSNGSSNERPLKLNTSLFRKAKVHNANRFTPGSSNSHRFAPPQPPSAVNQGRNGPIKATVSPSFSEISPLMVGESDPPRDTQNHDPNPYSSFIPASENGPQLNRVDFPTTPESSFSFRLDPVNAIQEASFTLDPTWDGTSASSLIIKPSKSLRLGLEGGPNAQSGFASNHSTSPPASTPQTAVSGPAGLSDAERHHGHRESNKRPLESPGTNIDDSKKLKTAQFRMNIDGLNASHSPNSSRDHQQRITLDQHAADNLVLVETIRAKYTSCTLDEWFEAGQGECGIPMIFMEICNPH